MSPLREKCVLMLACTACLVSLIGAVMLAATVYRNLQPTACYYFAEETGNAQLD